MGVSSPLSNSFREIEPVALKDLGRWWGQMVVFGGIAGEILDVWMCSGWHGNKNKMALSELNVTVENLPLPLLARSNRGTRNDCS